ncbi:hypothetical protein Ahy_B05g078718 [Arachis hypogaea]|uniref:Uncharacterized protein n=1 Tax=Arachis hypogaea TaxID=3818 RepID=A0A444Z7V4_ARAHY|nr:hypothetical protein Ahy_B05g078718 [Arachis hypogaea]
MLQNKQIFRRFQGKTLKNLTDEMIDIGIDNDQDLLMFKRIFILYNQMAFLLPTTINKVSPVHLAPIFRMDNITECKGITNYHLEKKKSMGIVKKAEVSSSESDSSETELDFTSESESEQDSEEATKRRKQPTRIAKKVFFANDCLPSRMVSRKMKQILEDSISESESESDDQCEESSPIIKQKSKKKIQAAPKKTQSKKESTLLRIRHLKNKFNPMITDVRTEELEEFLRESKKKKTHEKAAAHGMKGAGVPSTEGHYDSSEMQDPLFDRISRS